MINSLLPFSGVYLNVVIETPKGSRNKFNFDPNSGLFKLGGVLPTGASFPFDFGFIPRTHGEDGDPLDVLLIMDEPAFPGCLIEARLLGVMKALQNQSDTKIRNDRIIAVATHSRDQSHLQTIHDLSRELLEEIEHFFRSDNEAKGKQFIVEARNGPKEALQVIKRGMVD